MNAGASANAGCRGARWACGVVLAVCAAFAVLVHHETAASPMARMTAAAAEHSGQVSVRSTAPSDAPPADHGRHAQDVHEPAHGSHDGACTSAGVGHCTTANVDTPKLPVPPLGDAGRTPHPDRAAAGVIPAGTVSRAPPDLSALCLLRI